MSKTQYKKLRRLVAGMVAAASAYEECVEIATRIISETCYEAPELNDPSACIANADRMKQAIAAALQAERAKLASVEESARQVIEQAVHVLATRPITGERHTVLTDLEAWLAEHLVPVKSCPDDGDVQRESAEKP